ncbi:MAG: BtpA/SgcQ family protein, partial [Armatimonadetes bacterium]|nr:BtpA/SgcQ family protein [Armatimonadota bacterium]
PPETLAALAVCTREVTRAVGLPIGVNLLRNDAVGALAAAAAAGARFIRVNVHTGVMVTDQGMLTGAAHETLRARARLGEPIAILADVWVKHADPLPGSDLARAAEDTWRRGLADGLIVTGTGTGRAADLTRLDTLREALPEAPLWIGSGVTPESLAGVVRRANGVIVGSALEYEGKAGRGVDPDRAAALVAAARAVVQ